MKKFISMLLILMMICACAAPCLAVEEKPQPLKAQDSCGDTATYTFDSQTGTLTVTGSGAIRADAFSGRNEIKRVVISDGISAIGDGAFFGCAALRELSVAASVTELGSAAFMNCCALQKISFLGTLPTLGGTAFGQVRAVVFLAQSDDNAPAQIASAATGGHISFPTQEQTAACEGKATGHSFVNGNGVSYCQNCGVRACEITDQKHTEDKTTGACIYCAKQPLTASVISGGSIALIAVVAVLAVGTVAVLLIRRKKTAAR